MPLLVVALFIIAALSSCEKKSVIIEPLVWMSFSVVDSLDVDVAIVCSFQSEGNVKHMISLNSQESYTYSLEMMTGNVTKGKIPVNEADTLRIIAEDRPVIEFMSRWGHSSLWKQDHPNGVVRLVINDRLWE